MTTKQDIVRIARAWIGTRFHHQGRLKRTRDHRGGCDCIGLIVGVVREAGLLHENTPLADFDRRDYGRLPQGDRLHETLCAFVDPITEIAPGDLLLFAFDENPQHLAIAGDYAGGGISMIHSYLPARGVVEHRFDASWRARLVQAYQFRL